MGRPAWELGGAPESKHRQTARDLLVSLDFILVEFISCLTWDCWVIPAPAEGAGTCLLSEAAGQLPPPGPPPRPRPLERRPFPFWGPTGTVTPETGT